MVEDIWKFSEKNYSKGFLRETGLCKFGKDGFHWQR
jgi:hypothetical protein